MGHIPPFLSPLPKSARCPNPRPYAPLAPGAGCGAAPPGAGSRERVPLQESLALPGMERVGMGVRGATRAPGGAVPGEEALGRGWGEPHGAAGVVLRALCWTLAPAPPSRAEGLG